MVALPLVLTLVPLTLVVAALRQRLGVGHGLREAVLVAGTLWTALLVAFTELLSLGRLLTYGPLLACWTLTLVGLGAWVAVRRERLRGWRWLETPHGLWEWTLLGLCALLVAAAGAGAALTPPNNIDALIYHLPRQVHWMQQASVAHYPTSNYHQLVMPPLAEFIGMHLMILSGGDGWANLVQWFALVLTMIAVSLIARDLGLGRAGQLLAALFVVTIPMAFLQALNPKNDLVASCWLCSASWWTVRLWAGKTWDLAQAGLFGISVGLLVLTKGTGYFFALPVVLVAGLGLLWKQRRFVLPAGVIAGCAGLLLNAGHWTRNYVRFHSLSHPVLAAFHDNEMLQPQVVASNLIRNVALHLGTQSKACNARLFRGIAALHRWLGIDVNDPRTTLQADLFPFQVHAPERHEDVAPAPIHVGALLVLSLLLPFGWRQVPAAGWALLSIAAGGLLLFCAGLKWQIWGSRLQLPLLCLGAVVLAGFCTTWLGKKLAGLLVAGCLAVLVPYAATSAPKPLLTRHSVFRTDRLSMRLNGWPERKEAIWRLARDVAAFHPQTIGLQEPPSQREYVVEHAIWEALHVRPFFASFEPMREIPPTPALDPRNFQAPDLVVAYESDSRTLVHALTGTVYEAVAQHFPYTIYRPCDRAP